MKTWIADPAHSRIGFSVKHLNIIKIYGHFSKYTASAQCTQGNFADAVFRFAAQVDSIHTDAEARDTHLKSEDFFDAAKYPELTFESTSVDGLHAGNGTLKGNLTLHGITKPVTLTISHFGTVMNPMNQKETAGFRITGDIKRSDYNLGPKFPDAIISDRISLKVNIECFVE